MGNNILFPPFTPNLVAIAPLRIVSCSTFIRRACWIIIFVTRIRLATSEDQALVTQVLLIPSRDLRCPGMVVSATGANLRVKEII